MIQLNSNKQIPASPLARLLTQGVAVDEGTYFYIQAYRLQDVLEVHLHVETSRKLTMKQCPAAKWDIDLGDVPGLGLSTVELDFELLNDIATGGPNNMILALSAMVSEEATLKIAARGNSLGFVLYAGDQSFLSTEGTGEVPGSWVVPAPQMERRLHMATEGRLLYELLAERELKFGTVLVNATDTYALTKWREDGYRAIHLEGPSFQHGKHGELELRGKQIFMVADATPWRTALPNLWKHKLAKFVPEF